MYRTFARTATAAAAIVAIGFGLATSADAATASARPSATATAAHGAELTGAGVAPASFSSCISGDFCAWSGPNGTGTKKAWYICQTVNGHPFTTTNGSFYNNQTGGAPAKIYFSNGDTLTVYPGITGTGINWNTVTKIRTCP